MPMQRCSLRGAALKKLLIVLLVVAGAVAGAVHFMTDMPGTQGRGAPPMLDAEEEALATRLHDHVYFFARDIGVRNTGAFAKMGLAGQEVEALLRRARLTVKLEAVTAGNRSATLFTADVPGTVKPEEIVLVGTHYDSPRSSPGADCNASGTAVALELARKFASAPCERTLRFAFFALSESPFAGTAGQGAHQYAVRCKERNETIVAAVLLEGLGNFSDADGSQSVPFPLNTVFPDEGNFLAFLGDFRSRELVRTCVAEFRAAGRLPAYGCLLPSLVPGFHGSDAMAMAREGIRAVLVTDTGTLRSDAYGDASDTPDRLDYARMARACTALRRVIEALGRQGRLAP